MTDPRDYTTHTKGVWDVKDDKTSDKKPTPTPPQNVLAENDSGSPGAILETIPGEPIGADLTDADCRPRQHYLSRAELLDGVKEALLAQGHRIKETPRGFKTRCPVHSGRSDDSLTVWLNERGDCCVKCHGGCERNAILDCLGIPRWEAPALSDIAIKPTTTKNSTASVTSAPSVTTGVAFPDLNKDGDPVCSPENIAAMLRHQRIEVWYDDLAYNYRVNGLRWMSPYLEDASIREIQELCRTGYGFSPSKTMTWETVMLVAETNRRHPVREYLDGLVWDGTSRLANWLIDYAGADDTELNREVGSLMLVAAVRRVKRPGVKYDLMPILEGVQGSGKSSLVRSLAVCDDWYGENVSLAMADDPKKLMENVSGKWINEIADLRGNKRADMDALKSMLSRQEDVSRMAYDRMPTRRARQWVMIGTTNNTQPLRDQTGNRRFLPIPTGKIDLAGFTSVVDQLWAEVVEVEKSHGPLELPSVLWDDAARIQESRTARDPWEDIVENKSADYSGGEKISGDMPYEWLGLDRNKFNQSDAQRLNEIMRRLGWDGPKTVKVGSGKTYRGWVKG
jgi:hypothetical protein